MRETRERREISPAPAWTYGQAGRKWTSCSRRRCPVANEWGGGWDGDRDDIRGRGTEICRKLGGDVEHLTPPGVGRWERTWEIVAPADSDFMAALSAWECDPMSEPARVRVKQSYAAVLRSWRQAVAEHEREGASR